MGRWDSLLSAVESEMGWAESVWLRVAVWMCADGCSYRFPQALVC